MYVKLKWLRKPKTTAVPIPECAWKEISFNRLIFNTTRCIKSSTSIFLRSLERFSMSYFPQYTSFSWGIKSLFSTWLYALWKTPNPSSLVATFTSDLPADSRFTLMIQFRIFAPYFFLHFPLHPRIQLVQFSLFSNPIKPQNEDRFCSHNLYCISVEEITIAAKYPNT